MAEVGDNLWYSNVCWGNLGIDSASGERGAQKLTDIVRVLMSVEDIWSGIGLVGTNHGAAAAAAVKYY